MGEMWVFPCCDGGVGATVEEEEDDGVVDVGGDDADGYAV